MIHVEFPFAQSDTSSQSKKNPANRSSLGSVDIESRRRGITIPYDIFNSTIEHYSKGSKLETKALNQWNGMESHLPACGSKAYFVDPLPVAKSKRYGKAGHPVE